jgi:hypothetical protein
MDELLDRAREWVNENYPQLEGEEYTAKLQETVIDLARTDNSDIVNIEVVFINPIN